MIEDMQTLTYHIYVTDCLRGLAGASKRYADIAIPEKFMVQDDRSPEEIIDNIKTKLGTMSAEK